MLSAGSRDGSTVHRSDDQIGRSELRVGAPYQPDFPAIERFIGAFGDGSTPPVGSGNDVLLAADGEYKGLGKGTGDELRLESVVRAVKVDDVPAPADRIRELERSIAELEALRARIGGTVGGSSITGPGLRVPFADPVNGLAITTGFPFPAEQLPDGGFLRGFVLGQSGSVLDEGQPSFAENLGAGARGLVLSPVTSTTGLLGEISNQYRDLYDLATRSGESYVPSSALLNSLQHEGVGGTLLNMGTGLLSTWSKPVVDLLEGHYEEAGGGLPATLSAGVGIVGKFRGLRLGEATGDRFIDFNSVGDVEPGFYRADPRQLRFMQPTVSPNYSIGGHTIASTADDLRFGRVTPDQLGDPLRIVMSDGKPFSFDNRRVLSYNLADVRDVPIQIMGMNEPVFASKVRDRFNPIEGQGLRVIVTPSSERNSVLTDLYRRGMIQKPR